MRLGLICLPLLTILISCSPLKSKYAAAASKLHFVLTQVEPNINIIFPISKTKIDLNLTLEVENASTTSLLVREFEGELFLNVEDKHIDVGHVKLLKPVRLPAKSKANLSVTASINHSGVTNHWKLVKMALEKEITNSWELSGTISGNIHGISIQLPIKSKRSFFL